MVIRLLSTVTAALVAGFALTFVPTAPASADEPGVRRAPPRYHAPRVVVRTVERTRVVYVPQPVPQTVYQGCGGCAPVVTQYSGCCGNGGYYGGGYYGGYHGAGYYGAGYYGGGYHGGGYYGRDYYGRGYYGGGYSGAGYYGGGYYGRPFLRGAPYRWAYRTARYNRYGAFQRW